MLSVHETVLLSTLNMLKMMGKIKRYTFFSLKSLDLCDMDLLVNTNEAYHMGLNARKPVFEGLRTTKAQTSLCIRTV